MEIERKKHAIREQQMSEEKLNESTREKTDKDFYGNSYEEVKHSKRQIVSDSVSYVDNLWKQDEKANKQDKIYSNLFNIRKNLKGVHYDLLYNALIPSDLPGDQKDERSIRLYEERNKVFEKVFSNAGFYTPLEKKTGKDENEIVRNNYFNYIYALSQLESPVIDEDIFSNEDVNILNNFVISSQKWKEQYTKKSISIKSNKDELVQKISELISNIHKNLKILEQINFIDGYVDYLKSKSDIDKKVVKYAIVLDKIGYEKVNSNSRDKLNFNLYDRFKTSLEKLYIFARPGGFFLMIFYLLQMILIHLVILIIF